jgi:hypothetical protein
MHVATWWYQTPNVRVGVSLMSVFLSRSTYFSEQLPRFRLQFEKLLPHFISFLSLELRGQSWIRRLYLGYHPILSRAIDEA